MPPRKDPAAVASASSSSTSSGGAVVAVPANGPMVMTRETFEELENKRDAVSFLSFPFFFSLFLFLVCFLFGGLWFMV